MGIILLPLGALVIGLYFWAGVKGTRWAYRKFAIPGAIVAIAFFALLPTWDTKQIVGITRTCSASEAKWDCTYMNTLSCHLSITTITDDSRSQKDGFRGVHS